MISKLDGDTIVLPGLASAHSHAFQRALRGHCQKPASDLNSFWSWRRAMYALVQELTPESMYLLARFAYAEMAMAGMTAVGEFHYLHHQKGGQAYQNRTEMSDAVILAACDVGLRINLQRVVYERAGFAKDLAPGQDRFCDTSLQDCFDDVETLQKKYQDHPLVNIGLAIHSVRAVSLPWIREISTYAKTHAMPLHMHLSEQRAELEECQAEHGLAPVALMDKEGILDKNFVAVHATHLAPAEFTALGKAQTFVCICRTTERDLGDGHCDASAMHKAGVRICTGIDSHAVTDPFEECRAIELDERSQKEARTVIASGTQLLQMASTEGYAAIGLAGKELEDQVVLDANAPSLVGISQSKRDDFVAFASSPHAVKRVSVANRLIVKAGIHVDYQAIRKGYLESLGTLPSSL